MTATAEIRPLCREDDQRGFSCGQGDLDRFLEHYAGQNQFKHHVAVTYVAASARLILGFATIASGALERRSVTGSRLRRRLPSCPLPILRLARLGVEERAKGLGIGKSLLRHVLNLSIIQRDSVGCVGVVTDAKIDTFDFCARLGFTPLEGVRQGDLTGSSEPMFLPIGSIEAALES